MAESLLFRVEGLAAYAEADGQTGVLRREPVDIGLLLENLAHRAAPMAKAYGLTLATSVSPGLPPLVSNRIQLGHALDALIDNAIRYNHSGVSVKISAYLDPKANLVIEIEDDGPGLSELEILVALQPFGRVEPDAADGALGLGLPRAKALVSGLGGELELTGDRAFGCKARVILAV